MTGPTFSATTAEIALCLSCTRKEEECIGGDPECPWGLVYWQERTPEERKAYMREYDKRRKKQEGADERHAI